VGPAVDRQSHALLAGGRLQRGVSVVLQDVAHQGHVLLVVFDDQYRAHPMASWSWSGSRNVKVAPSPGRLSTRIDPPCSSTKRRASASPSPVPSALRRWSASA